jgi:hypothetical protein
VRKQPSRKQVPSAVDAAVCRSQTVSPMSRGRAFVPCRLLVGLLLALVPIVADAHEERDVGGGQYALEVGFQDEPGYLD